MKMYMKINMRKTYCNIITELLILLWVLSFALIFFVKTRESHENVCEYTQTCVLYLLLIEHQHFALSRKKESKEQCFQKEIEFKFKSPKIFLRK